MVNTKIRLIILFAAKDGKALNSQQKKKRPRGTCGSDRELLIAKFRFKQKKLEKTSRSFKYDLNQIVYNYTVKVRNRFNGIDLIEALRNYGRRFVTLYRRQGLRPSPRKNKCKKCKIVV